MLFRSLLFFLLAVLILARLGTARLEQLGGLARRLPLAAGLFVLATIAVLGLPPLSGFISKLWILKGFAAEGIFWPVALILLAALLEAGYYFRWIQVFYRQPSPVQEARWDEQPQAVGAAYLPLLLLAGLILLLGVAPGILEASFQHGAESFLNRDRIVETVLGGQS